MSSTAEPGSWVDRARGQIEEARLRGILPDRVYRADDGSLIAPSFAFGVPWIPVVLATAVAGIVGLVASDIGGIAGFAMAGVAGAVVLAAPYLLHRLLGVAIVAAIALMITGIVMPAVNPVIVGMGMLWFFPARRFHWAVYDAKVIQRADNAMEWAARGAILCVILEVLERERADGAKVRIQVSGSEVPRARIIRGLPSDCGPGALLAIDRSGTCLEALTGDMHDRYTYLEETVR